MRRLESIWPIFFHGRNVLQQWDNLAHSFTAAPKPRNRPPSHTSASLRFHIVGDLAYLRVLHPQRCDKINISRIMEWYGVSRRHVYDSLKAISPRLRAQLEAEAAAHAESKRLGPADLRAIQAMLGDAGMRLFRDLMT
jgi:hypothetical protein